MVRSVRRRPIVLVAFQHSAEILISHHDSLAAHFDRLLILDLNDAVLGGRGHGGLLAEDTAPLDDVHQLLENSLVRVLLRARVHDVRHLEVAQRHIMLQDEVHRALYCLSNLVMLIRKIEKVALLQDQDGYTSFCFSRKSIERLVKNRVRSEVAARVEGLQKDQGVIRFLNIELDCA